MVKALGLLLLLTLAFTAPVLAQEEGAIRQWAVSADADSEYGTDSWSAMQATGAPNSLTCGDSTTAWASATASEVATIRLYFSIPVIPTEINIYQNYNPGAITSITFYTAQLDMIELDDIGAVPDECPGVHVVAVEDFEEAVIGVTIEVDQSKINNWSEIDAVELVGVPVEGEVSQQWASSAEASSQFGDNSWSAAQATGRPNTLECGDYTTAWASASSSEVATLTVYFDFPVVPLAVNVYQNYNPGAISKITLLTPDGDEIEVEDEGTLSEGCPALHTFEIDAVEEVVSGVIIEVDQSEIGSWSEIDAVELIGLTAGGDADNGDVPELTETFDEDGFSIDYPADWETDVDESGIFILASSNEALENRDDLGAGDVVITILPPSVLESQLDLDPSDDPDNLLEDARDFASMNGEVEDYDVLDNPAAIAFVTADDVSNFATLIVVAYDDGAVLYAIDSGDLYEDIEPLIIEMLNTAEYQG